MATGLVVVIPLVLVVLGAETTAKELPDYMKRCRRNDLNLNECLKSALQGLRDQLRTDGIPEFKIPVIDPLQIPKLVLNQATGPVTVRIVFENATFYGFGNYMIQSVRADLKNNKMEIFLNVPSIVLSSKYKSNGRMFLLPIQAEGYCNNTLTDVEAKFELQGKSESKADGVFWQIESFSVIFDAKKAHFHYSDIFTKSKELSDNLNAILNENSLFILNEIKEEIGENLSDIFREFAKNVFGQVPVNSVFIRD